MALLVALNSSHGKVWNIRLNNSEYVGLTIGNKDLVKLRKVFRRQYKQQRQTVSADFHFRYLFLCLKFR